jgi:hypothetical protein
MIRCFPVDKTVLMIGATLAFVACSKNEPPKALAAEQVPGAVETAFKDAPAEAKTAAKEVVESLQGKDEVKAFFELQNLSSRSDLTPEQRQTAARSMLSVNERLRAAGANGDQRAADALQSYRSSK